MEQHDIPGVYAANHSLRHLGGVQQLPVLGVHGPIDHGGPDLLRPLGVHLPIGGAQPEAPVSHHLPQHHLRLVDLLHHVLRVHLCQPGVGIGVVADLVAVCRHAAQQVLVSLHLLADNKKGGRRAAGSKALQQPACGVGPGAVVKGQRHIFRLAGKGLPGLAVQIAQDFHRDLRRPDGIVCQVRLHIPVTAGGQPGGQDCQQKTKHFFHHPRSFGFSLNFAVCPSMSRCLHFAAAFFWDFLFAPRRMQCEADSKLPDKAPRRPLSQPAAPTPAHEDFTGHPRLSAL